MSDVPTIVIPVKQMCHDGPEGPVGETHPGDRTS